LVLTGKEDVLIPPENSRILAERIPNAQLQMIEGGGHQFLVEQAHAFNAAVLKFLTSLS
jgi:pimeloyl-ACP methyl ester carboxylesterase